MNLRILCLAGFALGCVATAGGAVGGVFSNDLVTLSFDASGNLASVRERKTGRELVARAMPGAILVAKDGKPYGPVGFGVQENRLMWRFPDGEAEFSIRSFDGGWRLTLERNTVPGWKELIVLKLAPTCVRYSGWRANILSDDDSAVSARAYGIRAGMKITDTTLEVRVNAVGQSLGFAAGPREGFVRAMRAMTVDSGAPHTAAGGAWSVGSEACRGSYLHVLGVTLANVDEHIRTCEVAGVGTLHIRECNTPGIGWYKWFGHYPVDESLFPGGKAGLKKAVDKIHEAGLKAGMHTLTVCIDPRDEFVHSDDVTNLLVRTRYTLAEPLVSGSTELRVREMPKGDHDLIHSYAGNGNTFRLGYELVQYTGIRREKPYAFTGIVRGAFGTPVSDHAAGDPADYLRQRYLAFYPDPETPLLGKVADAVAGVFNDCGFDQIYCDGAEGIGSNEGITAARWAIAERLAPDGRPVINEGSHGSHSHCWWFHSRVGNLDVPAYGVKAFHDLHLDGAVEDARKANFLDPQLGWWGVRTWWFHSRGFRLDEMEYFAARNVAEDTSTSLHGAIPRPPNSLQPYHALRLLTVFGWYERARLARAFSPEALAALRKPKSEHILRQSKEDGCWYLTEVRNPERLRVEAPYRGGDRQSPKARVALDVPGILSLPVAAAEGVKASLSAVQDKTRGPAVCFRAENGRKTSRGAWASAVKTYAAPSYFDAEVAPSVNSMASVWIRGDGSGALLNVQLRSPREYGIGYQEHYVKLDFRGWRRFEFAFCENDAAQWRSYEWPYRNWTEVFCSVIDRKHLGGIAFFLNDVPAGSSAEVALSDVRIVPMRTAEGVVPGQPFALKSGDFAECDGAFWTHYDKEGNPLERRVAKKVEKIVVGPKLRAFTDAGARRIRFEAMTPMIYGPAHGFDTLDPVVVRPGEKARLDVRIYGPAPACELQIGEVRQSFAAVPANRELNVGSKFGVFSGTNPVTMSIPYGDTSRVRLEIFKRYVNE